MDKKEIEEVFGKLSELPDVEVKEINLDEVIKILETE